MAKSLYPAYHDIDDETDFAFSKAIVTPLADLEKSAILFI